MSIEAAMDAFDSMERLDRLEQVIADYPSEPELTSKLVYQYYKEFGNLERYERVIPEFIGHYKDTIAFYRSKYLR
jgi:hypothetical protein